MIGDGDTLTITWLPTTMLVPKVDDEPLVDMAQLGRYVEQLAAHPGQHTTPIEVEPIEGGRYRIRNGRHRWLAHVAMCKQRVRCMVVGSPHRDVER